MGSEQLKESGGVPSGVFAQMPDYKFNVGICLTSDPNFLVDPLLNIVRVGDCAEEREVVSFLRSMLCWSVVC